MTPADTMRAAAALALMSLVSEYGQCRWSEGSSGATYLDRMGERRSREEAYELYRQIERCVIELASIFPLPNEVLQLLNHIEDVVGDEAWARIDARLWNAVTKLAAGVAGTLNDQPGDTK